MIRGQPAVEYLNHFDPSIADDQRAGRFIAAVPCVALDTDHLLYSYPTDDGGSSSAFPVAQHMIAIRRATAADAQDWLRLRQALWPEDGAPSHAAEIEQFFAGKLPMPLEVLLAADPSGAVLGFAELSIRSYAEDCVTDRVAYLEGWYVVPASRRKGVGRLLIAAAEDWALAQGCSEFASDALIDNYDSAAAHEALGFVETVQIRCFRKSLAQPPRGRD